MSEPAGAPAFFGADGEAAVAAEYAAARADAALASLPERAVLEASGPQRQKFLNGVLSNELLQRAPGQGCLCALMDVKGHVQVLLRALVLPDVVRLELPADRLAAVEATLLHYKLAAPVRFAARPVAVLGLVGPRAEALWSAAGGALPAALPESHVSGTLAGQAVLAARAGDLPGGGLALHVDPQGLDAVWGALVAAGARPLGRRALDALRVEAGLPWYGPDVSEENLLHETGLVPVYHSGSKGCYLGQEVVARLEARGGNVNKALRGLRLGAPCAPGAAVLHGDEPAGRVTTSAVSPRLGPLALAFVHRKHFAPGSPVTVEGRPAEVVALPFPGSLLSSSAGSVRA